MAVNIWIVAVMVVFALISGFRMGRSVLLETRETEQYAADAIAKDAHIKGQKRLGGQVIVSPVAGEVSAFSEGRRNGALIKPDQGKIFSPVSGRVSRLYPMGRALLITADLGVELLIQIGGSGTDEMCSSYYRSRVMQNEVVSKGKCLLEFDPDGLKSMGVEPTVAVSVEGVNHEKLDSDQEISVNAGGHVRVGDELLWIGGSITDDYKRLL